MNGLMKDICDKSKCTGCMACFNVCNQKAITIKEDDYGFVYPLVLENQCVQCGQCYRTCPQNKITVSDKLDETECMAGWNNNLEQRKLSSSGGVFAAISTLIIQSGGVVFGAAYGEDQNVRHIMIDRLEDIHLLQGSKYLQSQIGNTFKQCVEMIDEGRNVLFTGTPCQIDGLYALLGNRRVENLLTMDLLCHGVPSYKTIRSYLDSVEQLYGSKVKHLSFRNKKTVRGWEHSCTMELKLENGKTITGYKEDIYFWDGFLRNIFLRDCCYNCKYAGKKRMGDITIGDFWGIQNIPEIEKMQGVSLILCNSDKGRTMLESANVVTEQRTLKEAISKNQTLEKPFAKGKGREEFFQNMEMFGFRKAIEKNAPQRMRKLKVRAFFQNLIGDNRYQKIKVFFKRNR